MQRESHNRPIRRKHILFHLFICLFIFQAAIDVAEYVWYRQEIYKKIITV